MSEIRPAIMWSSKADERFCPNCGRDQPQQVGLQIVDANSEEPLCDFCAQQIAPALLACINLWNAVSAMVGFGMPTAEGEEPPT